MGYLIEFKEKNSPLYFEKPGDNFTEERKALVSFDVLSRMLTSWRYLVFTARLVDMERCAEENGEQIEILTEVM